MTQIEQVPGEKRHQDDVDRYGDTGVAEIATAVGENRARWQRRSWCR
jgi:hypothetical protein